MELWIRSQSKRGLLKPIYFGLDNVLNTGEVGIKGYISGTKFATLGYYETEKRALEVLDEIQELLEPVNVVEVSKKEAVIGANILYEMPEE